MNADQILNETKFKAVRSSGAGGQHVNKVATKVILIFNLRNSVAFTPEEKERLYKKLGNKLSRDHTLIVQADDSRSQVKNREIAGQKLLKLLSNSLETPKRRKKTKPSKSSKERRLKEKMKQSEKKAGRKKPGPE